jgi:hypothetical protein
MLYHDLHADGIFVGIRMCGDQVATGGRDVGDQVGRRIDPAILTQKPMVLVLSTTRFTADRPGTRLEFT